MPYTRTLADERLLVILNFTKQEPHFVLPAEITFTNKTLLISNYAVEPNAAIQDLALRPYEARIYQCSRLLPR